jgi:hypothetical protein
MTEALSDEALAHLQRSLLEAILLDRPLPGAGRAPAFADRGFFADRPTIALLDEDLAAGLALDALPAPVRVFTREQLDAEAEREGDVPYLRFSAPERVGDAIRLRIDATIATAAPDRQVLGLSGVQAAFREVEGRWQVEGDAISSAS